MLYFAYGSNMNHAQMRERCPGARFLTKACLEKYRLVYDGHSECREGAVANVVPDSRHRVWGALFEVSQEHIQALDLYEECARKLYDRKHVWVKDEAGRAIRAWIYSRKKLPENRPAEDYRDGIRQGARDCGLPSDYIDRYL